MLLGLILGIVLFIVAITGAMYSFKSEIEALTQSFRKVTVENRELIAPSTALIIGKEANPNVEIHGIIYRKQDDALEVVYYQEEPLYYGASYLNPYTGEVLKTSDFYRSFFGFALRGHIALWLPLKIGMPIVAISTLVFLIMFITGLVLWWPKKAGSTKNFVFTKDAKPSVKILEWHKVVGFYVVWLALILVLTGMTWLFPDFDKAIYNTIGGKKETRFDMPASDTTKLNTVAFTGEPIDILWNKIRRQYPEMPFIEIHAVHDSVSTFLVELNRNPSKYWKMDFLYFDQHTLEPVKPNHIYGSFTNAGIPEKVKRMYYDIHTGAIWGLPGKIIMFLASLFCASLPITGFIMWLKRQNEKKAFLKKMEI
jgi:uncharacterized iron-regulated membrane protein